MSNTITAGQVVWLKSGSVQMTASRPLTDNSGWVCHWMMNGLMQEFAFKTEELTLTNPDGLEDTSY